MIEFTRVVWLLGRRSECAVVRGDLAVGKSGREFFDSIGCQPLVIGQSDSRELLEFV